MICDILWSDPDEEVVSWGYNERGVSFTFSKKIVEDFIDKNGLDLILRAHQVVDKGYEFFANKKLVTIFSAPNYCGEFDNWAGLLSIDENLRCSFKVLKPVDKSTK